MKLMVSLILPLILCVTVFAKETVDNQKVQEKVDSLQKPLYNPFVENYILNEIKTLRDENRQLKVELHQTLAKKEVEIANNAVNYATSTINNMFYIIAAASSLLVLIGWSSIKDMNSKIKGIVDEKVSKVIKGYEERMKAVEKDLEKRSKQVFQNQKDIEESNIIHSLWMRTSQETTPSGKIEIYDEILSIRPDDVEAITYKSDAILDLGEANWALTVVNQALKIDDNYSKAYYQRAKINVVLENIELAIEDLTTTLELNDEYVALIETEEEFQTILSNKKLKSLIAKYSA